MTKDQARRRAVEAAAQAAWGVYWGSLLPRQEATARNDMVNAIAAYERAMADAGWRMARVGMPFPKDDQVPSDLRKSRDVSNGFRRGWNACRAAMLAEDG